MGGKRWTDAENAQIAMLAEHGLTATDNLHLFPGRTFCSVTMQASRIGIALSMRQDWEQWEKDLLTQIYQSGDSIKLAVRRLLPHRGYMAAKSEAVRIGLNGIKPAGGRSGYSWVSRAIEMVLADGEKMTADDLAFAIGASGSATRQAIAKQHGKKMRIGDWKRGPRSGYLAAMWQLGAGADAPRPSRLSSSELSRRAKSRERNRARASTPFSTLLRQVAA